MGMVIGPIFIQLLRIVLGIQGRYLCRPLTIILFPRTINPHCGSQVSPPTLAGWPSEMTHS